MFKSHEFPLAVHYIYIYYTHIIQKKGYPKSSIYRWISLLNHPASRYPHLSSFINGLVWENLQETIDFPIKPVKFPLNQSIEFMEISI